MRLAVTATPSVARFAPLLLHGDPATAFYLARELGYDGVELHLRRPEDVNPAEIARLSTSCQLAIPTLGTGMAAGEDGLTFADPDPAIRRAAVDRVRDHIRLAAELGSAVTIGLIRGRLGPDPEERRRRQGCFLQCLEECCQAGEDLGVTLLLEPLNRFESDHIFTLAEGRDVIGRIGAPNLKLLADTFHMNIEEVDLAASLRACGDQLGHVHLVDSNREAPGHGHLNLAQIVDTLRDMGYQGFLAFEILPLPDAQRAALDAIAFVKPLLKTGPQ